MSKFIIDNVIIEKSDKDIKTDVKYDFISGINIICGNNETGKSSLMQFIKEGLFRPNKTDNGKIFFSVNETSYRADIKNNPSNKQKRCIISDKSGNNINYSEIEKMISKNYFQTGFTINLDDLINLNCADNSSLVNCIKDPSGDKLNSLLAKINNNISLYTGINGKARKILSDISDSVYNINSKIKDLSLKETEYNNAILNINEYEEQIQTLNEEEKNLNYIINLKQSETMLSSIDEQLEKIKINFNEKLFNEKDKYIEIIQNTGKFESYKETTEKNKLKIEEITSKLNINIKKLNEEFSLDSEENTLINYVIDNDIINNIKNLLNEIEVNKNEIKAYEKTIDDIEDNIIRLNNDLEYLDKTNKENLSQNELEVLYSKLDEGIKQYKFLTDEINTLEQKSQNSLKIMILIAVLMFITAFLLLTGGIYIRNMQIILWILSAVLIAGSSFLSKELFSSERKRNTEKLRKSELRTNIVNDLKLNDNLESFENKRNEINTRLLNIKSFTDKVNQIKKDIDFNNAKKQNKIENIESLQTQTDSALNKAKELVTSTGIIIEPKKYVEAVELIKIIKEQIKEKNILIDEINKLSTQTENIINSFNNFIIETGININISSELKDNTEALKAVYEQNTEIKHQKDILEIEKQKHLNEISEIKQKINNITIPANIEERLEEISVLKKEKQELKKECEFLKRELEDFEGITDLKTERNILTAKYTAIIKQLFIDKTILAITAKAKSNFDKTQPDLVNAENYLSVLTGSKYSKINLNTEEIESSDGIKIKKWNELSRGTKEQLYLALRLGYASNYSKDKTTLKDNGKPNLPVIIDDAFVNFDYKRTQNALKCLFELSKNNQVLFFTCHTDVIKQHLNELGLTENNDLKILYIN